MLGVVRTIYFLTKTATVNNNDHSDEISLLKAIVITTGTFSVEKKRAMPYWAARSAARLPAAFPR